MAAHLDLAHPGGVAFWQVRDKQVGPPSLQVQRTIAVLIFHTKQVMEVAFLPAQQTIGQRV